MASNDNNNPEILVTGATGLVGRCLVNALKSKEIPVCAISRKQQEIDKNINWVQADLAGYDELPDLPVLISTGPLDAFAESVLLSELENTRLIIAVGSMSAVSKETSGNEEERAIAKKLRFAEEQLMSWSVHHQVPCVLLRSTMIYGHGRDKNISQIAGWIQRHGYFPLAGRASGLRQPIHCGDIVKLILLILQQNRHESIMLELGGGEQLVYRKMVDRIYAALGKKPRYIRLPSFVYSLIFPVLRFLLPKNVPGVDVIKRQNKDLIVQESLYLQKLGFKARPFQPGLEDIIPEEACT